MSTSTLKTNVAATLEAKPIIGVVRTGEASAAERIARQFLDGGLELVEITFSVPEAPELAADLLRQRSATGPPWIGMGTVTNAERARRALGLGAEFIVSPNCSPDVASLAREAGRYLVLGSLSPTEIVRAHELGADIVKVFPLPPVGGPDYLRRVRGPLGDIPMLASGGYGVEEIPGYREAGATAFGIGDPLLGRDADETRRRIRRALSLARGEER